MKILLTGSSGFLGREIRQELAGQEIITLGRRENIKCDLSNDQPSLPAVDLIVHAAGKAHMVPQSARERQEFYNVNVKGTANLLDAVSKSPALPKSFVFISSVAVYGLESGSMIAEDTPLLATDPYGNSKIKAEHLIQQWCDQNNVICTILRLPLLAGPNPPGNLKNMIDGINKGYYLNIAGGKARKSMVLAEDVAKIIPRASRIGGIYNLTDGHHPSFSELSAYIALKLDKKQPGNIPSWLARTLANIGNLAGHKFPLNKDKLKKITCDLTFDDSKAFQVLDWCPTPVTRGFKLK